MEKKYWKKGRTDSAWKQGGVGGEGGCGGHGREVAQTRMTK
jgi:hypothetical protein